MEQIAPNARGHEMSTEAVDHHRKAAEHFEHAAQHHSAAATHYGAGQYDQASREAYLAHGHYLHASNHAAEAARLHARHFGQK